ncbi:MAG: M24 family metallopeptidase [Patescibacteria group bacterium]|nr:M24 family metallopeptidase [Patescibacteria group bacterium]
MEWNAREITNHTVAARYLTEITRVVWHYFGKNPHATEHEIEQFIHREFKLRGLISRKPFHTQIVAFDAHAAIPHYFPSPTTRATIKPNTLILLDIWAKLKNARAPYADITWIAYTGEKIPREIQKVFDIVLKARDACITHLKASLRIGKIPTGAEMDNCARAIIAKAGYGKNFIHSTGHCIGFTSPHGRGVNLSKRFRRPLTRNMGYTIEPGIYLKNKFGIRSEINFYIDKNNKIIITTPPQKRIVLMHPKVQLRV